RKTAFGSWWNGSGRGGLRRPISALMTGSRVWRPAPHFAGGSHTTPKSGPSSKNAILQSWTAIRRHASRSAAPHARAWSPWSTVRTTQNNNNAVVLKEYLSARTGKKRKLNHV